MFKFLRSMLPSNEEVDDEDYDMKFILCICVVFLSQSGVLKFLSSTLPLDPHQTPPNELGRLDGS